jgi:hypothetical protein
VIVVADGALFGLLSGVATGDELSAAGLLRARGGDAGAALDSFVVLAGEFAAGPFRPALARSAPRIDG